VLLLVLVMFSFVTVSQEEKEKAGCTVPGRNWLVRSSAE